MMDKHSVCTTRMRMDVVSPTHYIFNFVFGYRIEAVAVTSEYPQDGG